MQRRALWALVGLCALACLTGCSRKFTRERFDMVTVGADEREDVEQILGEPTQDLRDQWFYDDLDRHQSAIIYYNESGKVSGKEWMDANKGRWEGTNPHASPPPRGEVRESHTGTRRIDEN